MDSLMCPVSFNVEAIPDSELSRRAREWQLAGRCPHPKDSLNPDERAALRVNRSCDEFRSGRRRYSCRAFPVDLPAKGPFCEHSRAALQQSSGLILSLQEPEQFNFTRRERETLEFLLQGLSNKEIASRMKISPNTIKVFLRLIMVKMGVCSRAAIVLKLL